MQPSDPMLLRLKSQLDILPALVSGSRPAQFMQRPASGKWSAHENLAHLARYHEIFIEHLKRVLAEDSPDLGRYRAEDDPNWAQWRSKSIDEVLDQLTLLRGKLVRLLEGLDDNQLARPGIHPLIGPMSVRLWLEFFLLHEGHHLYTIMKLLPRQSS